MTREEEDQARLAELEKTYGELARLPYEEIRAFLLSWRFEPTGCRIPYCEEGRLEEWGFPGDHPHKPPHHQTGWRATIHVPTEGYLASLPIFSLTRLESRFHAIVNFAEGLLGTQLFDPVFGKSAYYRRVDPEKFLTRFRSAPSYEEARLQRLQKINRKIERLETIRFGRPLKSSEERELILAEHQLQESLLND